ncbi:hypothetical protein K458DRAFT_389473 [Lentithecium fluviatile CBS 122367]|uniref:Ankyrin n=1 Tax=Lentithecium fluviatile CBS 122367 TaxID=1168545 RepID=A0A6G1IZ63_9PLEO|nr:hypothetical protein K458DRAFT_389473 [Lentithecium fluviatile CBS 122367]
MIWACIHNHTNVVQKLVTRYEASACTITISAKIPPNNITDYHAWLHGFVSPLKVLTLNLVVRKCHVEAFKLLLELGACVNVRNTRVSLHQSRSLLRRLFCPPQRSLLILLDALAKSRISLTKLQLDRMLILSINSGALLDLIESILDLGANPNFNHPWRQP